MQHEARAMHCHSDIQERLRLGAEEALQKLWSSGVHVYPSSALHADHQVIPTLVSGAGHDALMMAHLTKVHMHKSAIIFTSVKLLWCALLRFLILDACEGRDAVCSMYGRHQPFSGRECSGG